MKVILYICLLLWSVWPPGRLSDYEQMVFNRGLIVYEDGSTKFPNDDYWYTYHDENHVANLTSELGCVEKKLHWLELQINEMSMQTYPEAVNTRKIMEMDQGHTMYRRTLLKLNIEYLKVKIQ